MKFPKSVRRFACLALAILSVNSTALAQGGGAAGGRGGGGNNRGGGLAGPQGGQRGGGNAVVPPGGPRGGSNLTLDQQANQYRDILEVADDPLWNLLLPLITDVISARNAMPSTTARGGGRAGRGAGGGGGLPAGGRGAVPAVDLYLAALDDAIARNASTEELKAATAKVNDSIRAKQEALLKAQAELRKALTVRQEAVLTVDGLLLPSR